MATASPIPAKYKPSQLYYPIQTGIWRIRNSDRDPNDIPPEQNTYGSGFWARSKGRHWGWDLESANWTAIYSIRGGKVTDARTNDNRSGWGPCHLEHSFTFNGEEYHVRYAHLFDVLYSPGQEIEGGVIIGHSGETGFGSPPHLHIEFKKAGVRVNPTEFFGEPPII